MICVHLLKNRQKTGDVWALMWEAPMWRAYVNRLLICHKLTFAARQEGHFIRSCWYKAPKIKHEQWGRVSIRACFVVAGGLLANIYMTNTINSKTATETEQKNAVAVKAFSPVRHQNYKCWSCRAVSWDADGSKVETAEKCSGRLNSAWIFLQFINFFF